MKLLKNKLIITISYFLLLSACLYAFPFKSAFSEAPKLDIKTRVDKEVVEAGETFTYILTISGNREIAIDIPDFGEHIGDFPVVDSEIKEGTDGDKKVFEKWYTLRAEKPGAYPLPGITLTYKYKDETKIAETQGVKITVKSVESQSTPQVSSAQEGESEDIKDIKSLQEIPVPLSWYLTGIAVAAFFVIADVLIYFLIRRKKNKIPPPLPPVPPQQIAREALEALKQKNYLDRGQYKMFHYSLSEIFRNYLEARFGFPATDLTTEEIIPESRGIPGMSERNHRVLNDLLKETDLVKFADSIPTKDRSLELLNSVIVFVEETYKQLNRTEEGGGTTHEV